MVLFFVVISGEVEVVQPSTPVETLVTVHEPGPVHWRGRHTRRQAESLPAFVPLNEVR